MTNLKTIRTESIVVGSIRLRLADRIWHNVGRRTRWLFILLIGLLLVSQAFAAGESELQVRAGKPGAIVTLERQINDGMVQLSVSDAANRPIIGMTKDDFVVTDSGRTARIISAQSIANSLDVPRNIVMVLDNSDSMSHRSAVKPLLAGVDELLKIVRPIDQVQIVVFSGKEKMTMGGRDLRVRTFKSNNPGELRNFVREIYRDGMTQTTVLNEGMLAGLELIRALPANEPRFMVIFSDGEDLNSAYNKNEVTRAAEGVGHFNAYAIDYMPDAATDKFLMTFAKKNHGQIWKAKSETSLVPIFQSVASKMQYYYVVSYLFPTKGSLAVAPASVTINELAAIDPLSQPEKSAGVAPAKHASGTSRIDSSALILRPVVDTAYSIARWKIILANSRGTLVEKDGEGTPPAEIVVPLKTDDLGLLATGGDIKISMEVQDSKGQSIVLTAPSVKVKYFKTTGSLAVTPSSLTIEEIKTIDSSPMLGYIYFLKGASDLSAQYVRLAGPEETAAFDEQRFRDTLEKYYQVLNIIGKRLTKHPAATITLTGCNDNTGTEKRNRKLSTARAESVGDYLQAVWNIAPDRIRTDARNLPEIPSTSRLEEGRAENRRVEIRADDSSILAPVRSTYMSVRIDADALTLRPAVNAPHDVANWTVRAANNSGSLGELSGEGAPPAEIKIPMKSRNLNEVAVGGDITLTMVVKDRKGQKLELAAGPVKVNFIQTSQRLAQKQDFRVQEKYALILFDFDSDAISARNQEIVNAIVARIKELSEAQAEIVGHTDNIGKDKYNIKLSQRRALSVYKLLSEAYGEAPGDRVHYSGVGPNDPLFDNMTPEARALNRTVIITLEYMAGN
jgi:outer membrane protein OmpA-like peptidoglycan-associated protein